MNPKRKFIEHKKQRRKGFIKAMQEVDAHMRKVFENTKPVVAIPMDYHYDKH